MKKFFTLLFTFSACLAQSQTFTSYTTDDGLINNTINSVDVDNNDGVWFGTQEGISHFDGTNWTNYTEEDGLVHNTVWAIMEDSQDVLWVGTDFGISSFDGVTWTTYTTDDGLEDNRIKHIFEDSDGIIWFGNNDGVSSFDGSAFTNYTNADGLPFGGVNHVNQDLDGNMWFSTGLGGAWILADGILTGYGDDEGLISNSCRSIAIDDANNRWIASAEGISILDANNNHILDHDSLILLPEPHLINPVTDVKIDSEGRVWGGVYVDYLVDVGGISLYDGGVWTGFDVDDGLAGPAVTQLSIDSNDDVWVATTSGATKISDVPLSIEPKGEQHHLAVYPNPSNGFITVVSDKNSVIQLYSASGSLLVSEVSSSQGTSNFDFSSYASGIYILKSGVRVTRLIIQ